MWLMQALGFLLSALPVEDILRNLHSLITPYIQQLEKLAQETVRIDCTSQTRWVYSKACFIHDPESISRKIRKLTPQTQCTYVIDHSRGFVMRESGVFRKKKDESSAYWILIDWRRTSSLLEIHLGIRTKMPFQLRCCGWEIYPKWVDGCMHGWMDWWVEFRALWRKLNFFHFSGKSWSLHGA